MKLKQQILDLVEEWIGICNDDLCHYMDPDRGLITQQDEVNIRDVYDRKLALVKFRQAFSIGSDTYAQHMLCELVNAIVEGEDQ